MRCTLWLLSLWTILGSGERFGLREPGIRKEQHFSHARETHAQKIPALKGIPSDLALNLRGGWASGAGGGGAVTPAARNVKKSCGTHKSPTLPVPIDVPEQPWTVSPPLSPHHSSPRVKLMADLDEIMTDVSPLSGSTDQSKARSEENGMQPLVKGGKGLLKGGRIVGILGNGAFGTVYATVFPDGKCVAVKVQRAGGKYAQVTFDEIELLKAVGREREESQRKGEDVGGNCVVELLDTFEVTKPRKQMCMSFEMLGPSLLDLVIDHGYRGIPIPLAKAITRHALRGLHFLHKHCSIIHTDVKPENILLTLNWGGSGQSISDWWAKNSQKGAKNKPWKLQPSWSSSLAPEQVGAKLVDLGNSCFDSKHFSDNIQTIEYRSPEVIIGAGYSFAADMWSLACTVFELVTGEYLFDPQEGRDANNQLCWTRDEDLLAHHQELLGVFPKEFAMSGKQSAELFTSEGSLKRISGLRFWGLKDVLMEKYGILEREAAQLTDFLIPMLSPDPTKRACALDRLQHSWLAA